MHIKALNVLQIKSEEYMKQMNTFLKGEGDNWFKRNEKYLKSVELEKDMPLKLIVNYNIKPKKVLEIGCSNGFRLHMISNLFDCECLGIEPSKKAILDGRNKYKNIKLLRGTCSKLPTNEKFDLVIVNFVLHWIDRNDLKNCFNEIDRVLDKKGILILGDFYPKNSMKNKYHHLPDENLYTYKEDYATKICDYLDYVHIAHFSTKHGSSELKLEFDENERISYSLLLKDG